MISGKDGFTLMELMIVIAIICIISWTSFPNLILARNNSMLRSAAFEVVSIIKTTRMEAIRINSEVNVDFSLLDSSIKQRYGIERKSGLVSITFNSRGMPATSADYGDIIIGKGDGRIKTIRIAVTGHTRIIS